MPTRVGGGRCTLSVAAYSGGGEGEKGSKTKLTDTTPVHARVSKTKTRENTVRPLALSVLCWVFVRASFLRSPEKKPGHLSLTEGRM